MIINIFSYSLNVMKNLFVKWALGGQGFKIEFFYGPVTVIGLDLPSRRLSGLTKYQPAPSIVSIVKHLKRSLPDKAIYALTDIALIIRTKSVKNCK